MFQAANTHIDAGFLPLKSVHHVQNVLRKIAAKLKTRPKLYKIRYIKIRALGYYCGMCALVE